MADPTTDLLSFFLLLISLGITLAIFVPLTGALVRFRANYNPKGLQLDAEGGVQPHTGPVVSSFFGMLKRVYRIEGKPGLYKGLMPTAISTLILTVFVLGFFNAGHRGAYSPPPAGPLGMLGYSIFAMLLSLPSKIITYRAITTPHKLPYFKPIYSLRVLLTPTERRRPWIIYLTPGLLTTQVIHIAYVVLGLRSIRHLLLPTLSQPGVPKKEDVSTVALSIYFVIALFSTVILTPLEVIATRLAIQRNHATPEYNSVVQEEEGDADELAEYSGAEEDVIGLRNEKDPYLGMIDCVKSIMQEEGYKALYRAWWLTLLGCLVGAFS